MHSVPADFAAMPEEQGTGLFEPYLSRAERGDPTARRHLMRMMDAAAREGRAANLARRPPRRPGLPRTRPRRIGRPGVRRRSGAGSRTASADPGGEDGPPCRPRAGGRWSA
jgi:hypothetical protein